MSNYKNYCDLKERIILFLFAFCCGVHLSGQHTLLSAGNDLVSGEAEINQSIGQIFVFPVSGSGVDISPGVQQAFEYTSTTIEDVNILRNAVSFYPNPFSGKITGKRIQSNEQTIMLDLFDSRGRFLKRYFLTRDEIVLDFSVLPSGIYFIKLSDETELLSIHKLLKS